MLQAEKCMLQAHLVEAVAHPSTTEISTSVTLEIYNSSLCLHRILGVLWMCVDHALQDFISGRRCGGIETHEDVLGMV